MRGWGSRTHNTTPLSVFWRKLPRPFRAAAVRLLRCLSDPADGDRRIITLLLWYAVLWTISATVRNLGIPLQGDMLEAFALSREPALGYIKHPPLINWLVAAWFAAMPTMPGAFYLLAMLNAALAMWLVWLAAAHVVDRRRRVVAVALLGLTPIFTVQAATFNHNAISLSLWPLVALSFYLSIERPQARWSLFFGAASGLAILGKYYAGLIVLACVAAALLHPNRRSYFRSARPYLAAATCAIVLAPNLYWLVSNQFISITVHVMEARHTGDIPLLHSARSAIDIVALLSPALLTLWLCLRPWTAAMVRSVAMQWPADRIVVACIALFPIILPLAVMPLFGIAVHDPWSYPAFFFLPLALVSAPRLFVTARAAAAIAGAVAVASLLAVAMSPLAMVGNFLLVKNEKAEPYVALAKVATDAWHQRTGRPLEFISGSNYAAWATTFYSSDHPRPMPGYSRVVPQVEIEKMWNERGVLGICDTTEVSCTDLFAKALPEAARLELTLPVAFLGFHRAPQSYTLYFQIPRSGG